ncbi:MAG: YutD-like domain-containing protein [Bacilli bacterium]
MNNEIIALYDVIEVHKMDDWKSMFCERYVDLYGKYDYILGDMSAGVLRITGFYHKSFQSEHKYHLRKRCAYDAPFFVLKLKENYLEE